MRFSVDLYKITLTWFNTTNSYKYAKMNKEQIFLVFSFSFVSWKKFLKNLFPYLVNVLFRSIQNNNTNKRPLSWSLDISCKTRSISSLPQFISRFQFSIWSISHGAFFHPPEHNKTFFSPSSTSGHPLAIKVLTSYNYNI